MVPAETAGFTVLGAECSVGYMLEKHAVYVAGNPFIDYCAERTARFFGCLLHGKEVYVFLIHRRIIYDI